MAREYALQPFSSPVNLQIDYARELNPQQLAAVTAPPGPALVLAGAGAGKTRTLIYRVAYLLEQGVQPERILLLTFTNKAAKEMMRRVTELLGGDLLHLWGGTFHSIGHRILRRHAHLLGCQRDFTILDSEDAKDLLKSVMAESNIDFKKRRFPKADVLQDIFSLAINTCKTVAQILEEQYDYFSEFAPEMEGLAKKYVARKRQTNVMDFDDLLVLWLRLLQEQAEVCEQYQRRFQAVLVDEYQDTNKIQADLVDCLAGRSQNLMVVGDDSQSIYSWRGANFQNILEFPKRYPKAKIYKIETNYRSTPEILEVANAAIAANEKQFPKKLAAVRKSGSKPALVICGDGGQQAAFIAQRMLELREEGVELNKMAVLYRSHFHALELQLELTRRNIPFSITSGPRFFEQAHLKDVTAYLKLVCNPRDETAFKRLAQLLPGIGAKGAEKLWRVFLQEFEKAERAGAAAIQTNDTLKRELQTPASTDGVGQTPTDEPVIIRDETASSPQPSPPEEERGNGAPGDHAITLGAALQACLASVPKKAVLAWTDLAITFSQLEEPSLREHPNQMMKLILEAGYDDYLKATYPNYRSRREDLDQLANFAFQFRSLQEFLAQLSLLTNLEAEDDRPVQPDTERVKLSTIHQAKGLEFDVVFVIMLCDGLFPSFRSLERPDNQEEERRLFYVSVTRARNELYFSYPLLRMNASQGGPMLQQSSRFLKEIPPELLEQWDLKPMNPYQG